MEMSELHVPGYRIPCCIESSKKELDACGSPSIFVPDGAIKTQLFHQVAAFPTITAEGRGFGGFLACLGALLLP